MASLTAHNNVSLPGNNARAPHGRTFLPDNKVDDSLENYFSMAIDDDELLEFILHPPAVTGIPFVLEYEPIGTS